LPGGRATGGGNAAAGAAGAPGAAGGKGGTSSNASTLSTARRAGSTISPPACAPAPASCYPSGMTQAAGKVGDRTVHEALREEIAGLPEPLAREALDFILFVKDRHAEEQFLWAQVEETRRHRAEHPDEVTTVTADEWDRLTGGDDDR
jgi:hypothetical protein